MNYISTECDIVNPRFGHAWRAKAAPPATVNLGAASTYLCFSSAKDARAAAAACTEAGPRRMTRARRKEPADDDHRRGPELGTTYLCRSHNRLTIPVLEEGEDRMRHSGPGPGLVPLPAVH